MNTTLPALLLALLALGPSPDGTAYYVDAETGADANTGTEPATAWKSVARVNAAQAQLRPGDRVLFRRGQTFAGPLLLGTSGKEGLPITYGSYGDGAKPELTGFVTARDWKPAGEGVWEAPLPTCASPVQVVTVDGVMRAMGRTPNTGYRTVRSHAGRTSITDPDLPESPDWTGAEVVIRKYRWVLDRCRVTKHAGHTLTMTSPSTYDPVDGHGYFLQNHPGTLDAAGEWYFDPAARTLRVFFGASGPRGEVRASAVDLLIDASRRTDTTFVGLRLTGANRAALKVDGTFRMTVRDCDIRWSGTDAVQGGSVTGFVLEESTIEDSANGAVAFHGGVSQSAVRRVKVHNTAMMPGMGGSGDGTYNGITMQAGNDNTIENFRITNTGYIPVHFSGSRVTVRNGFIDGFASVKDDAGGIYTWTGATDKTRYTDRRIEGNIVLHSRGAPDGAVGEVKGFGIYLDDAASEVDVRDNVVAHTTAGIFLHNAHHCQVTGNTFFDNETQILIAHDDLVPGAGGETRGLVVRGNTLVSRTAWQPVLSARSRTDDFDQFGEFDKNLYARPADQGLVTDQGVKDQAPRAYDLDGRRAVTKLDAGSRTGAVAVFPYQVRALGPELAANGDFATGAAGASCWSTERNGELTWSDKGPLDGGCVRHRFKEPFKAPRPALVLLRAGALAAGKRYLLRCTTRGSAEHGSAYVKLRETEKPWGDVTEAQPLRLEPVRREAELLFTVSCDRPSSDIVWTFNERDGDFWIDNVSLREATVVEPEPDVFRLDLNESDRPRTVTLERPWVDVEGTLVVDRYILGPRAARVLVRKDACLPK